MKNETPWNRLISGSRYRYLDNGIVMERGKRTIYLLCPTAAGLEKARKIMVDCSFNRIFNAGRRAPYDRNTAYIRLTH